MQRFPKTRFDLVMLSIIGTITVLLYTQGVTVSFSSDDYIHLSKNVFFTDLSEAISLFFELDGREYRPLVRFSLWLNSRMGVTALPFHITNLLLHLGCSLCLYFILRLTSSEKKALIGVALFALHPIHTTNVNWIMGRTDLICAFFYLLSVLFFLVHLINKDSIVSYCFSIAFFLFALLSKEMAISLPLVLLLLSNLGLKDDKKIMILHKLRLVTPFFGIAFLYLGARIMGHLSNPEDVAVYMNFSFLHIIRNYAMWAFGLAYPGDLYRIRELFEADPARFLLVGSVILVTISVCLFVSLGKKQKWFFLDKIFIFAILWFVVTLIPIMGGNAHRWYLYLPSAALSIAIGSLLDYFRKPRAFYVLFCVYMLICALEVGNQSRIWAQQSIISQSFLKQVKEVGLDKLDAFYIANVPFGYKSAFLFTFQSLQEAIFLNLGARPTIHILSYINLPADPAYENTGQRNMSFRIKPDRFAFFIFPPLLRTFGDSDKTISIHNAKAIISELAPDGRAVAYQIKLPNNNMPLYFFNGKTILGFDLNSEHSHLKKNDN